MVDSGVTPVKEEEVKTKVKKSGKRAKKLSAAKKLQKTQTLTTFSDMSVMKVTDASSPKLF